MRDSTPRSGRVLPLLRTASAYEGAMWRSLFRWTFRRPVSADPTDTAFGYTVLMMPLLIVFIVVSAIELPIFHLILPWETVRLVVDLLGVYGLLWMIGLLAMVRIHPHLVGGTGLRIRNSASLDVTIGWDAIASIQTRGRDLPGRTVQFDRTGPGVILQIGVMKQTNIDVVLHRPTPLPVKPGGDPEPVTEVRFYADDATALVRQVRQRLPAGSGIADSGGTRHPR